MDAEPAEAGYSERHNDVDQDRGVGVREVEEDEDDETESFNEKVGRDPDKGWVDQLVVVGADADHEEDAGGRRDGREDHVLGAPGGEDLIADVVANVRVFRFNLKPTFSCSHCKEKSTFNLDLQKITRKLVEPGATLQLYGLPNLFELEQAQHQED